MTSRMHTAALLVLLTLLVGFMAPRTAQGTDTSVSLRSEWVVVRGEPGTIHPLPMVANTIDPAMAGWRCTGTATANNKSIHRGNDVLIGDGVAPDMEGAVGRSVAVAFTAAPIVNFSVRLGADGVWSGGVQVTAACAPPATTTTESAPSTTTAPSSSTALSTTTEQPATTVSTTTPTSSSSETSPTTTASSEPPPSPSTTDPGPEPTFPPSTGPGPVPTITQPERSTSTARDIAVRPERTTTTAATTTPPALGDDPPLDRLPNTGSRTAELAAVGFLLALAGVATLTFRRIAAQP